MKKAGILGGTFDPVHFGHINLALSLKESCGLDVVYFVPAGTSPFKESAPPTVSGEHRLEMLKRAIAPIPEFQVLDWEVKEKGPSYTINTVRKLAESGSMELHLLIGEDHSATLHLWKDAEELVRLAPPLVGARTNKGTVAIPILDISSTMVRARLSQKKYCGHLVPASVLEYIKQHNLY